MNRPSWTEYYMRLAELVATRSTCIRRHVGSVIVKDKQIIATGYNGSASGLPHCTDLGNCAREGIPSGERVELCRAIHAEQNALIQAAKHGISVNGATVYITLKPCTTCAKLIVNAGIKKVVYGDSYPNGFLTENILCNAGVILHTVQEETD